MDAEMRIWNELEKVMNGIDIVFYDGIPCDVDGWNLLNEEVEERVSMGAKIYFFEDLLALE